MVSAVEIRASVAVDFFFFSVMDSSQRGFFIIGVEQV